MGALLTCGCKPTRPADGPGREHIGLSQMQVSRVLRQSIVRMREGGKAEAA
jgi:hypothetical protein